MNKWMRFVGILLMVAGWSILAPAELCASAAAAPQEVAAKVEKDHVEVTVDGKVFPRLCGLAEVLWSPGDGKDWEEFHGRMQAHARRLEALGVSLGADPSLVREG